MHFFKSNKGVSNLFIIQLMSNVLLIHENDANFPHSILIKVHEFLGKWRWASLYNSMAKAYIGNENIFENPEKHQAIIWEMKLEAALITNNSPYSEVRAVVSNKDDTSAPCSTIRAWTIGIFFSVFLAFINQLFSIRQPPINIDSNVAQLLAFPSQ